MRLELGRGVVIELGPAGCAGCYDVIVFGHQSWCPLGRPLHRGGCRCGECWKARRIIEGMHAQRGDPRVIPSP